MLIYLVRHGQAQSNLDKVCAWHKDSPLTELWNKQALAAWQTFAQVGFDQVYSSDLSRARDTAKYIIKSDQVIITDQRLRERCYYNYEWTNNLIVQHSEEQDIEHWEYIQRWWSLPDRRIEHNQEIITRREQFVQEHIVNNQSENILITSHGSFIRTVISHIVQWTMSQFTSLMNTSITILHYSTDSWMKLITYNQHTHILALT